MSEHLCRRSLLLRAPSQTYCAQVHEKLVPSVESREQVEVCGLLELLTLLISSMLAAGKTPMAPLVVLSVAALVPLTPVVSEPR